MKKIIKVFLYAILSILGIIILAAVLVPVFFKDEIKESVIEIAEDNLNAKLYFEDVNLSLFSHFPNLTAGLESFSVVGKGEFSQDTLVGAKSFDIEIDLTSVISGDYKVDGIYIINPVIRGIVKESGLANWDNLMKETTEEEPVVEDTSSTSLNLQIPKISILNGDIYYSDQTMPMLASLKGVDYNGDISINGDIYQIINQLDIKKLFFEYDHTKYLNNKTFHADMTLNLDLGKGHYEFKENLVKLNELALVFDGSLGLPAQGDMYMDIHYHTKETSFKNILSLVPADYMKGYENLQTKGNMAIDGFVKGTYGDNAIPNFKFGLDVSDAQIKYPDLPLPIDKINIDLDIENASSSLESIFINLKEFSLNAANNPLLMKTKTKLNISDDSELVSVETDTYFKTLLDFAKLTEAYPIDATALSGVLDAELSAKGIYTSQGDVPEIHSTVKVNDVIAKLEGDDKEYKISDALLSLAPSAFKVESFNAVIGKSDLSLTGNIQDYLAYGLGEEGAILKGIFTLTSNSFNVDEWMADTEEVVEEEVEEEPLEVVGLPQDLDFVFNSSIKKLDYSTMPMDNFIGTLTVKEGVLYMKQLAFGMLGGKFKADGNYDPRDTLHPKYAMNLDVSDMGIHDAYATFNTVKSLVPAADKMEGDFSTKVSMTGELDKNMNPVYEQLNGSGTLSILDASVKDLKVMEAVAKVAKSDKLSKEITVKDQRLDFSIENGTVNFKPFDMTIGGQEMTMGGSQSIDGKIDYTLTTDAPVDMLNGLSSKLGAVGDSKINIGVVGTYNKPKPKLLGFSTGDNGGKTVQSALKEEAKDKAKEVVQEKVDEKKEELKEKVEEEKKEVKEKAKKKGKELIKKLF